MIQSSNIRYDYVKEPFYALPDQEPKVPVEVYLKRKENVLRRMDEQGYDYVIFYADREHYSNFDYMVGFDPRFEEALLVLNRSGEAWLMLGNECYGMYRNSRIPAQGILCQALSLPNQPIDQFTSMVEMLGSVGIAPGSRVGVVGWKLIYPVYGSIHHFDAPAFLIDALREIAGAEAVRNVTDWFIHPGYGLRTINGADEIAAMEFGAAYASASAQNVLLNFRTRMTELEASRLFMNGGLPFACHPKVLSGSRMDLGMVSPTTHEIRLGDRFQVSIGLRGGLTNRRGFVAYSEEDLAPEARDYLETEAKPYFAAVCSWYEQIGIGVTGGELYNTIQTLIPKERYGWSLNPGHLIGTEEWLSSPIFPGSDIPIQSGMCVQMDIIPVSDRRYASPNCEDGIAIADEALREELKLRYPKVYERIEARRKFMMEQLNIRLKPEVLPLSNLTGLYRPFMLNREKALVVDR